MAESAKEYELTLLAAYVPLTPEDRGAVALLSAEELEVCRHFRTHPAEYLAEKRRQAAEARQTA